MSESTLSFLSERPFTLMVHYKDKKNNRDHQIKMKLFSIKKRLLLIAVTMRYINLN
jgi:hypothetical protein